MCPRYAFSADCPTILPRLYWIPAQNEQVEIFREGKVFSVIAKPFDASYGRRFEPERSVLWAGAVLQDTPSMVKWLWSPPVDGVYVSALTRGSPAHHYNLAPSSLITEVNDVPTPTLSAFIDAVGNIADGPSVRVKTLSVRTRGKASVSTLVVDKTFWPTSDIKMEGGDWVRKVLSEDEPPGGHGIPEYSNRGSPFVD